MPISLAANSEKKILNIVAGDPQNVKNKDNGKNGNGKNDNGKLGYRKIGQRENSAGTR